MESNNNSWYDRVYLCYEDTGLKQPCTAASIKGFTYLKILIQNAH